MEAAPQDERKKELPNLERELPNSFPELPNSSGELPNSPIDSEAGQSVSRRLMKTASEQPHIATDIACWHGARCATLGATFVSVGPLRSSPSEGAPSGVPFSALTTQPVYVESFFIASARFATPTVSGDIWRNLPQRRLRHDTVSACQQRDARCSQALI